MEKEKIGPFPLMNSEEEAEIIALSRGETYEYNTLETWVDLFLKHSRKTPEKVAVVDSVGELAYRELDSASNSIAAWLLEKGVAEGSFVALRMGRVKEFLAAVLGVHKAGAAYVPIDPEYPEERIAYMLEDSEAKAVLTEEAVTEAMEKYPEAEAVNLAVPAGRACMLYTSGSTGNPKGAVHRHLGLRALVAWMHDKFEITEDSVHAEHASFSFVVSLMDLLCPIAAGGTLHILSEEMRHDMADMKDYLTAHRISMAAFSTQIGMALVNQYPELPLRYLLMGGEKMLPCRKTDICLVNIYGATEVTISSYHVVDQEKDTDIPIGRPVPNTYSFVCDAYGHLMPRGMTGELCLAGPQIAEGYWKQPELTARSFVDCPFLKGQKMYRTGDLARYNEAGELEYLGRIDRQVKLRGFRIELGEIENRASQYAGIEQVAAEVRKEQLVLYYTHTEGSEIDTGELKLFLSKTLTEYMVPTVYMTLRVMPLNPNGKIDRKALPEVSITGENVPPETETEDRLFEIATGILKRSQFGVTDDLVSLGLSSIGAMRLAAEIGRVCDLRIPVVEILRTPTIRTLAAWVEQERDEAREQLRPYPKQKLYPITENQRGILIDWEQDHATTQYNTPQVVVFDGIDGKALVEAVKAAVDAHGYLKTGFLYADGDIMQQRREEDAPEVSLKEMDEAPDQAFFQSRVVPFELFSERLYRMEVYTFGNRAWLFTDIHHTVYDGLSRDVFMGEIRRALAGESLQGEALTAYDFALYEQEFRKSAAYAEGKKHFDALVEGASPAVLPDSRQPDGKPAGTFDLRIPAEEVDNFCKDCGVTAGSFFQAAFGEILRRLAREEKPFYVTVSSGRSASSAFMDSVGMFVKTLPVVVVRNSSDMSCREYVLAMHQELRESYAREFYPYTELVENHGLRAEVMFVYQGEVGNGGQQTKDRAAMKFEHNAVQFPIAVEIFSDSGEYILQAEYDGRRYSRADVELFAEMVRNAALGLARQTYVKDVGLVSADEAKELLALSAGETLAYNKEETWVELFLKQLKDAPEKTAVVDSAGGFTYKELDDASNSIAAWLMEKGVAENGFVAIRMGRVKEFLAAALGVHKAGAAYVPIDPEYPEERIAYMLEDSEAKAVLTEETVTEALSACPNADSMNRAVPEGRAYMIYTSGSTGKPKGVVIQHKAMLNFVHFIRERWHLTEKSRIACHSTFSFDASVEDLYPALTVGGCVFIVPEDARRDIFEMKAFLRKHAINGGSYSTQFGQMLAGGSELMDLDYICVGGEAMTRPLNVRGPVYNAYGPTEFTVDATYFELEKGKEYDPIPIGRPLFNTWAFVCDAYGHLLPKGMAGELCLAGNQIAEGYWKRPELTAKVFVDCPYLPGKKMYRTGDLARYNENGELEYLGRIDNQVKLRGFRIELGEIENRASQYDGIEQVAAEVRKDQLVLYYTHGEGIEIEAGEFQRFLSETLTEYMVPTVYMPLAVMPMTPSGKINRKALPEPEMKRTEYAAPANETEIALVEAFGAILGIREKIGAMDDFFVLGGDSIKAIRVVSLLRERGIRVSVPDIMSKKTVRSIASCAVQAGETVLSQEPYEGEVPDTAIVAFFKDLALPEPWHYNQSLLLALRERAVLPALQKALNALTVQHDLLRAIWQEEHIYVRGADQTIAIEEYEVSTDEKITEICSEMKSHIQMEEALVRVALLHGQEKDYLFITAHHLVVDGVSWRILAADLETAYASALGAASRLPEKTNTYKDYAETLQRYRDSYALSREIPYWETVEKKMRELPGSEAKDYSRIFEHIDLTMDRADTEKFLRGAFEKIHGDINDALLTAVARSYAKVQGVSAVSFQMEGHGREDLGESLLIDRTVGWFTSIYPVVVEDLTGDVLHDLLQTKEALHRIPNKGVGYNILRFIDGQRKTTLHSGSVAQIEFNYLGDMSVGEEEGETYFAGSRIDTGDDFSRKNVEGADLSINCMVMDGCFELNLKYAKSVYDDETAQHIAEGILEEMGCIATFLQEYNGARFTATDLGETEWGEAEFESITAKFAERGERIERIYPLLPMQEGMLLKHMSEPESWGYRLVDIYEMDWLPKEEQLRRALDRLGRKHEVLRTAILHENVSVPRQAIVERPLGLSMVDLSRENEPEAAVIALREELLTHGFDLQDKPLFRLTCANKGDGSSYLLLAAHHIIVDGWCTHIYMNDLMRYLKEEKQGRFTEDTEPRLIGVYETAVREILEKDVDHGLQYWHDLLAGYETKAEIPSYGEVPEEERAAEDELSMTLSAETTEKLVSICRQVGATPGNAVELLWGMVLSVCGRTEDVVFAKVVSGRDNTETDVNNLVGLFINSVPVRLKLEKTTTALEALSALQVQAAESSRYDYCPLASIQQQTDLGSALFQTVLAFENYNSGNEAEGKEDDSLIRQMLIREEHFDEINLAAYIDEGQLHLDISFHPLHYRESEIRRVLSLFKTLAEGIAEQPEKPLSTLAKLNPAEAEAMVELSKGEELVYDHGETWVDLFLKHSKETPEKTAVVDSMGAFNYEELDDASNRIASWLIEKGVEAGVFVALRTGRVKEFLAAVLGVHKAGAAYVPIDPEYPEERIAYMLEDSEAKAVLTEETVAEAVAAYPEAAPMNRAVPEGRAYMIYTSGSTGKPKGVVIQHKAMLNFVHFIRERWHLTEKSRIACHSTFSFDASVEDLYPALTVGGSVFIVPENARRDIFEMKAFLKKHAINGGCYSTQFGQILASGGEPMDLDYICVGGEAMTRSLNVRGPVYNTYGPTEFTVDATYFELEKGREYHPIPIGRPVFNAWAFVCDAHGHLLPQGMAGELCLAGAQIAEGYWKRPELTAKSFVECPFLNGQKMYRTGDLARYNEAGDLEYLGRIDNQVKLRGFRIELGEIENRASQFAGIEQAVAEVRKEQLVLYYTHGEGIEIDAEHLQRFLSETLTEYMVPTVYMPLAVMPMTPNGKIDRKALPESEVSGVGENVPPETETEGRLFEIAAGLLKSSQFGVTDHLVSLGLSSIGAMRLAAEISQACDLRIPVAEILRTPTIRALAAWVEQAGHDAREQLRPYPKQKLYPITENQRGIIIDWEQNRETTQYNIPEVLVFDGVEGETLACAVRDALDAHGYLKTGFLYADGDIMQQRREEDAPEVSLTELDEAPDQAFFQSRILPFELFSERLYRMGVYTFGKRAWLFMDIHHTVYDGLSRNVFIGEIHRALAGESLQGETLTAYDFALYEQEFRTSEAYAEGKKYFDALVEGASPAVLPDSRQPDGKPAGIFDLRIPAEDVDNFCKDCGVTAGSFFQAAFGETLRRLAREEKPFYVTVSSGRSASSAFMNSVGMFVKTLPVVVVRNSGDMTCRDYVRAMHEELRESYAREFYPYTEIVENHGLRAEMMFVYQGGVGENEEHKRDNAYPELALDAVQLPISVDIFPDKGKYVLQIEYDGMRYSRTDIESFAETVRNAVLGLARQTYVKDVGLVSADEAKELLVLSAGEKFAYNKEETWVNLFLKQLKDVPEKTAVVDSAGKFTYKELDDASNSIAAWLMEKGAAENGFVALRMGRVKEFLAAVLGVHKAGAAYVPIDPEYPEERIAYMLEDAEAKAVLTEETVAEALVACPDAAPMNRAAPAGRAYMIYTSGSTGKPKGVVIQHKAMLNFVHFIRERWHLTERSRIACHSTFSFDASVEDLYPALTVGGSVFIVPEDARRDIFEMKAFLKKHAINGGNYSTQFGQILASGSEPMDLDYINVGGEAMTRSLNVRGPVYNTYGPTEFTVDATYFELEKGKEYHPIPIGRPLFNVWAFVCDAYGHLLPKGMAGELCLAGNQIAEGYWKRPELTAKSFVECPFLNGQKMYRTGDLARYNEAGELEYLGRIDHQVKLRGFRIELGEIENCASQYAGIEQAAAEVRKEQLVLYYTHKEGMEIEAGELQRFLSESLTEYMVPTVYMPLAVMPMTPSGKIDRKALPEPEVSGVGETVPPATETESKLFEIAAGLLKNSQFGVTDHLVSLGLSSIGAMRFAAEISQACDLRIPVAEILRTPTIRALAAWVEQAGHDAREQLRPYPKQKLYPITENQRGIIIDWEQNRETTQYNIPEVIVFDGVEGETLAAAVRDALDAHAYLKTGFLYADGDIMQQCRDEDAPEVSLTDLDEAPNQAFFQSRVLPFDLFSERLYRMEVYTFEHRTWLFMDIHHTVYDGLSGDVFMGDIRRALSGESLKGETLTAYDFALYEKELRGSDRYAEAKKYFASLIEEAVTASIPESGSPDKNLWGACELSIPSKKVDIFCKDCGVTVGSFFQAAFGETLRRLTREEKPFYVTVSNGRSASSELLDSVGMFVKTLPVVVVQHSGDMTCRDYVRAMHEELQESYDREFYPYTDIVETHGLHAEVMFVYQGWVSDSGQDTRDRASMELSLNAVKLPITMEILPVQENYVLQVEYDGMRYSHKDVESFTEMVGNAAIGLAEQTYVKEVSLVSAKEAKDILSLSAGEILAYSEEETWVNLFLKHSKETPEKTAVVDSKGALAYKELDEASNSIAAWLIEKGAAEGSFVALRMGRVKEFLAAVIGVHKAGAAYVPIDPTYPEERIAYMLEDSEAKAVLTEEIVAEAMEKYPEAEAVNLAIPAGRAYMIYTSGSTGKPKGVVQLHRSLRAMAAWRRGLVGENCIDFLFPSFSFDSSLNDMIYPLTVGGEVHILSEALRHDMDGMKAYFEAHHVMGGTFPTRIGMEMVNRFPEMPLKFLCFGGEKMLPCRKTDIRLINEYGPTEFTVCSSYHIIDQDRDTDIPIGRPVPNTWSLICDAQGRLLPQGFMGELCLAGPQIAEGYWKRPELTAKVFVDCLYLPGKKMYRTGDLARYNENGELEYLGRIDHQVKLRGFRIELGEIENRASQYDGIEQVAAEVRKDQLVLYYTHTEGIEIDAGELRRFLSETLTEYMVPTVYMPLRVMPMTPNGKIDRKALPEPEIKRTEYIEPANETERVLAEAFGKILGSKEKIGALDDFFALGGDSIKAIRVVSLLRERGIRVSVPDIMSKKTVRNIAVCTAQAGKTVISQEPYEGEVADTAIVAFFKDLALPEPWHFNQCQLLAMKERAVFPALQKALEALTWQHDLLRAVWREEHLYVRGAGETIAIEEYEAFTEGKITEICNEIQSHIQMEEALVRVALMHGQEKDYLFIAAHHLVVDGVSWRIITADLESAYAAALSGAVPRLPEKTNTYKDYAETLQRYRDSYALGQEIPYWETVEKKMREIPTSEAKDYSRSFAHITATMGAEDTARFLRGAFEKVHGDINDALLTAVGRSYACVLDVSAVSFQMEGHGREDLGETLLTDRTVGWFTSIYPVVVEGLTGDMLHDLLQTKEALHRVPNKGVGYNILRFTSNLVAQIGFNYLGDMSVGEEAGGAYFLGSRIDTGDDFSRKNIFGPDLSINCLIMDGCFELSLDYAKSAYKHEIARRIADGIMDEMRCISSFLGEYDGSHLTATDLGEKEWSEAEFEAVMAGFEKRGEQIERIYPLLPMQEGMLLKHVSEPESWGYRLVSIYEMDWVPEESQLKRALERLGRKHEVLRTAIIHENVSVPRQAIVDRDLGLSMVDLSSEADPESAVKALREEILTHGFDLQKKPLFSLTCAKRDAGSSYLLLAVHHIIVDGWCMRLYLGDLMRYLKEEKQGRLTEETEPRLIGVYETAVKEILKKDMARGLQYWQELLAGYETKAEIPSYGEVPEEERAAEDELSITLPVDTTEKLLSICRQVGATPGNAVELLWGMVLSVCGRTEDVVFAKVVSGRDNTETDVNHLVGLFINSVPVRLKLEKTTTALEALSALQGQAAESNRYDYCPLASIQQQTNLGSALFQTVLAFENYNSGNEDEEDDSLLKQMLIREEHFDEISPSAYIEEGQLHLHISFHSLHYRESEIRRLLSLFKTLAEGIAEQPEKPLSTLAKLNSVEAKAMVKLSKGEELLYDHGETWVDLFLKQSGKTPEKAAVVDSVGVFTYKELDRVANSIAAWLMEKGVVSGNFVALRMGRVKEFLAAVIGVHKAGAAYVPIDPEYPEERIAYMLEDSEAKAVLTEETVADAMEKYPKAEAVNLAVPAGRAYMIYTSGSTGKPKGAVQSHRALRALVEWMNDKFSITAESVHAEHASFSFDASLMDLICPIAAGGTLHILSEDIRRDMEAMRDYLTVHRVSMATFSTQIGMALVNQYPELPLTYIMMGGEKMLPCKKTAIRLINGYGPTEFTVCSSYHVVDQEKDMDIPIGRPVPNTCSFICDAYGHLLPQGMAGELCLAGNQIAEGYWKQPELTARSFVECSFLKGQKMYRTGDLARYNEAGELEYLGRIDTQVKIRGFRIELGEIENRASQYTGMEQVAAEVRKAQLVLYYTHTEGCEINPEQLKDFLSETLTEYMVPTVYMPLAAMPMTPNGKIDRKALPEPDLSVRQTVYEAPKGEMEKKLCDVFAQILGLDAGSIGRNDDFFFLGGNSIKAMMVMSRCGIEGLSTRMIFKYKTARRIAEAMSNKAAEDLESYEKMARSRVVPATPGQIFMLDYQFLNTHSVMYNLPVCYCFDERFDANRLAAAVDQVVRHHPALYTIFDFDETGNIVQRIAPDILSKTVVEDISPEAWENLSGNLVYPFEMFRKPLLRVRLFRCQKGLYLFMDMHHTISDGTSLDVLSEDILKAYWQERLEADYYYSYVLKEYENRGTKEYEEAKQYFDDLLAGRNWCTIPTTDFESWEEEAGEEEYFNLISVQEMCRVEDRLGFSRNVLAIASAILALQEYCHRDEIRVDCLNNNRTDAYLQHSVGLIFKILPLAMDLREFSSMKLLLEEVNRQVVDGLAHSICDYSSADNVALTDALLINYIPDQGHDSDKSGIKPMDLATKDLHDATGSHVAMYIMEEDEQVNICIEYQRKAYAEGSMKKFLDLYVEKFRQLIA